jgi:hypothetical protein
MDKQTEVKPKLTKASYQKQSAAIEAAIASLYQHLKAFEQIGEMGEAMNHLHDAIENLQTEQRFLDLRWEKRNWTADDWALADLISSTVD